MFEQDAIRDIMLVGAIGEAVAFVVLTILLARRRVGLDRWMLATADRLGARPRRVMIGAGLISVTLCVALSALVWPTPRVQDEFSYRFAGATFASGRLAMPSPDGARHFQTEHLLVEPTFASKYPPAQGLTLGAGMRLGHPIIGVWISTGLMVGALSWMLFGWLPRRWAVIGSALVVLTPGLLGWWGHSYWGGSVAAFGGAIVLGAAVRFRERADWRMGLVLMIGVGILANARPYEGLVLCAPVGLWLATVTMRRHGLRGLRSLVLPGLLGSALILLSLGLYNRAVTGDVMTLPYALHAQQYGTVPTFFLAPPSATPATYDVRHVSDFFAGWEVDKYTRHQTIMGFTSQSAQKLGMMLGFYVGPACMLLGAWLLVRRPARSLRSLRRPSVPTVLLSLSITGSLAVTWFYPHYLAPACGVFLLAVVTLVRRAVASATPALGMIALARVAGVLAMAGAIWWIDRTPDWTDERDAMIERLRDTPGRDLILTRHGRRYEPHEEWVYNQPHLDDASVIWAWELDAPSNLSLRRSYPDRRVWLATPHRDDDALLTEYPTSANRFGVPERLTPADQPIRATTFADLDGRGHAMPIYTRADQPGVFAITDTGPMLLVDLEGRPASLLGADLDGDGDDELLGAMPVLNQVMIVDRAPDGSLTTSIVGGLDRPTDLCIDHARRGVLIATQAGVRRLGSDGRLDTDPVTITPASRVACSIGGIIAWVGRDGTIGLLTSDGPEQLRPETSPTDLVFWDDTQDGVPDLVFVSEEADLVTVLIGPDFARHRTIQCGVRPIAIANPGRGPLLIGTALGHGLNTLGPGSEATGVVTVGPSVWFETKATAIAATPDRVLIGTPAGIWSVSTRVRGDFFEPIPSDPAGN